MECEKRHVLLLSEALKTFSARQIRLLFVLQPWNRPMAYGESSREEVKSKESALKNFFQNVAVAVRDTDTSTRSMKWEVDPYLRPHRIPHCSVYGHGRRKRSSICKRVLLNVRSWFTCPCVTMSILEGPWMRCWISSRSSISTWPTNKIRQKPSHILFF